MSILRRADFLCNSSAERFQRDVLVFDLHLINFLGHSEATTSVPATPRMDVQTTPEAAVESDINFSIREKDIQPSKGNGLDESLEVGF